MWLRSIKETERQVRKDILNIERIIARLDKQKSELNARMLEPPNGEEALRLHTELQAVTKELATAEERWCELQEALGEWLIPPRIGRFRH